jgi:hypothetical protein
MFTQHTYRVGDSIATDYRAVSFYRAPQPRKYRAVTVSQMDTATLTAWRVSALNADIVRTQQERDYLARAEQLARQTARAKQSIAGYLPERESDEVNA